MISNTNYSRVFTNKVPSNLNCCKFRQNKTSPVIFTTPAMSLILKIDKDTIKKKITDQFALKTEGKL